MLYGHVKGGSYNKRLLPWHNSEVWFSFIRVGLCNCSEDNDKNTEELMSVCVQRYQIKVLEMSSPIC